MNISFEDYWENVSVFVKLDTEFYRKMADLYFNC